MPNYKELKKIAIEEDEKTIMRDKIWNFLQDCNLWEELVEDKPERMNEERLKGLADDIVERIHE